MSRGGRGGGGGFRGGMGAGGKERIGGQEMAWEFDNDLKLETKPQDTFPTIYLPPQRPVTRSERAATSHTLALRARLRSGPLYTVLNLSGKDAAAASALRGGRAKAAAEFNPFEDMPTYTQKYRVGVRKLPSFKDAGRRWQLHFFPAELWDTLDGSGAGKTAKVAQPGRRRPALENLKAGEEGGAQDGAANTQGDDADADEAADEEGNEDQEENPEDDFSEDDSDMGGDYNAENYFDAGDRDDDFGDGDALGDGDGDF